MFSHKNTSRNVNKIGDDLLKIAQFILDKVKNYAPFSSNTNIIEEISEEQPIHRLLWINAMRARNDQDGIRQLIFSWDIDISSNAPEEQYESGRIKIHCDQVNIVNLSNYLQSQCEAEDYHIELNDQSQVVEIECTLTDLNNYIYDEIESLEFKEKRKNKSDYTNKERVESITKRLAQWGIGNCSDLSQAAIALLMHYPAQGFAELNLPGIETSVPIETFSIDHDDHEFVVINRKADSDKNNPKMWGDDVILLDPWLGECYMLKDALSGSRNTPSVEYIFDGSTFKIEDSGFIAEGASEHWKATRSEFELFDLTPRVLHPEEKIPWAGSNTLQLNFGC
ncbi:hypothetical protein [Legionella bononiensis]|uniref:Uncharacterized protein n=1 Tax=Legionella bononiensis TaxID=2793102 RepID=A0ABS1W8V2_9GAMM|nr:hypothetical protein [Legionella bononiensis]MBL7479689.1 hypothetical protein [Legionella bononiensis]MBL7525799.1 hypothetical protein [Legionella bononiensis]MBL7561981.1 hypothetical protein [Legionella bononiensis]